jgi:hypothetical protein
MKLRYLFLIVSCILFIVGCNKLNSPIPSSTAPPSPSIAGSASKIELHKGDGFENTINPAVKIITDKKEIEIITNIINESVIMPGILDVAAPTYNLLFFYPNGEKIRLHIWIDGHADGMCMLSNSTNTGYLISAENRLKLQKILLNE